MRTSFDFNPFYRFSIGFDRMFDLLENASLNAETWPPYNIVKLGEDAYRIVIAAAGFAEDELMITHEANMLVITGAKSEDEEVQYLIRALPYDRSRADSNSPIMSSSRAQSSKTGCSSLISGGRYLRR